MVVHPRRIRTPAGEADSSYVWAWAVGAEPLIFNKRLRRYRRRWPRGHTVSDADGEPRSRNKVEDKMTPRGPGGGCGRGQWASDTRAS